MANDQHVAHDRKMIVEVEVLSFTSLQFTLALLLLICENVATPYSNPRSAR